MKIAISMVAGPLHKWGYQHVCQECIASQAEFADHVYLVQSTSDATGIQELLDRYDNITLISSPATWHHQPGETDEKLTVANRIVKVTIRNLAIGRLAAFRDGYEVVMSTDNNWYIPRCNMENLRGYCERFYDSREAKGIMWGLSQFCDKLFGPFHGELLSNLAGMDEDQIRSGVLDTKLRHPAPDAIPEDVNKIHFVDCNYEMHPEEYGANMVRFPDYKCKAWDWPTYLATRIARMRKFYQEPLDIPLDHWGRRIAGKSRPDFVSWQILKALGFSETMDVEEAVRRGIEANAMLYNQKSKVPDDKRDEELRFIYETAKAAPDGTAVECGVYQGGSLACWVYARVGRGPIFAVDNWIDSPMQTFEQNIGKYDYGMIVLTANSWEAPDLIDGEVAFCFIDADHTFQGIPFDVVRWPDKIMPGGFIVFHDYIPFGEKPTNVVKCIVDAWQAEAQWEEIGQAGSLIAFRKPV